MKDPYFRTMVEEKGILDNQFTLVVNDTPHYMGVENVIELIELAPNHEQAPIKNNFSIIDFKNGDLMHYIKFLAKCFIENREQA